MEVSPTVILYWILQLTTSCMYNFNTGTIDEVVWYSEYGEVFGHLKTLLKGKPIWTNDKSLERRSLEMRINIERQILRVGSLPNYESVV